MGYLSTSVFRVLCLLTLLTSPNPFSIQSDCIPGMYTTRMLFVQTEPPPCKAGNCTRKHN